MIRSCLRALAIFLMCLLAFIGPSRRLAAQVAAPAASNVEPVLVPRGTVIPVAIDHTLITYSAAPREPLSYTVVQDVVVNGHVIAKAGDEASGMVLEAQQGNGGDDNGNGYRAANLRVNVQVVHNFCGDAIRMYFIRSEYRRRQGIFGSHQDIEVVKGQKYLAQVEHAQRVCGEATSAAEQPLPADALGPDDPLPGMSPVSTATPGP